MASTSIAGAEYSSISKPPDSDNPNETAGINLPAAQNRKISFLEKVETIGSPTAQDGTNGIANHLQFSSAGAGAVFPPRNQPYPNPGESPLQLGSPQPGTTAYMNIRLPDGTVSYVPVVAQNVGGRVQWITTGPSRIGQPQLQSSPRGGAELIQVQRTGDGQAAYADPYSTERDSSSTDRRWYQSKKDMLAKKTLEWEMDDRARDRERAFEHERLRRASVSADAQAPDPHAAEIPRKQSILTPSKRPKSVLKRPRSSIEGVDYVDYIAPSPGGAPLTARPPSPYVTPEMTPVLPTPPLPDPGYYAQRPGASPPLTTSSGPSPYFSPPVSWLPNHMRRGQKSFPNSKSPSMLQECFSTENSPYYAAPSLTPGFGAADLPRSGSGFEQETEESGAGPDDLLFASGRLRLKGTPMATRWTAAGYQDELPSIVVWHLRQTSSPQDAENVLSDLLHATRLGDIGQEWITGLQLGAGLLQNLFRLADHVTPVESVLNPKSPCAEIIDLLLEHGHIDSLLTRLCSPDGSGATGIRYLICKARSMGNPPGEPGDGGFIAPWVADTTAHHAYKIASMSGADSLSMIPAIRLVESILPSVRTLDQLQRPIYRSFLEAVIRLIKRKELTRQGERPEVDPARRIAALHLISSTLRTYKSLLGRLEAESDMPAMPEKEWILEELGVVNIVPYLQDENSHPLVRCMALRVLRDFAEVDVEEVARWEKLEEILVIAVDVLLWRTKWQHGHEETSKSLGIAKFSPHEDAYRVITSSPTDLVIPILSKALKADDKFALLEPLLSLIVDHSKLKDKYWPFMLSMLLHCGCLSLFHDILLPPVPPEKDFLYRTTCRAKTDACIGLTRCFEQMRAKDVKTIPSNVGVTLVELTNDEQLPLNLRGRAGDAFGALKENTETSLEMPLEAPRPLNGQLDSTLRSPNPDSVSPVRSLIQPTGPVTEATPEPNPRSESPGQMPVPEPPNQIRPRPEVEPQHKGILKKWTAVFPEPREEASPYPQVISRQGGGYDGYEPPPPRRHASDRTLRPSSQPLSIRPLTASDSDPEPWAVKEQPDVQRPTLQPRAESSESSRTAISTFDENLKTPRMTFKSIVSDESGAENPNPPDQQPHSNSLRGAASAPPNGDKRGSGEDDLSAPPTPSVQSIYGTDDEPVPFIPQPHHLPPSQLRALPRGKRGKKR